MAKYWITPAGKYILGYSADIPPQDATSVPVAPPDETDIWDGTQWNPDPVVFKQAAIETSKRTGVSILGVMCSATKEDQNGLTAIAMGVTISRMAASTFPDTVFQFSNGSTLTITDENFDAVYAAWVPFRQSFFQAY